MLAPQQLPTLLSGPFRYADLLADGYTRAELELLLSEGVVRRLLHGVYAATELGDALELRAQAAALVVPGHAVIVDRAAAWLWGCDLRTRSELAAPPRLELFVPPGNKRITRREVGGGERTLSKDDVVNVGGVRVTTPLRTALDLGRLLPAYEGQAALDALARTSGVTREDLTRELPRFRGQRGVVQLRRLVAAVEPRSESSGESFTRRAILDAGLPAPDSQVWVVDEAGPRYRLDLAYEPTKVCVEYDGQEYHSSEERRAKDERRRRWLREQGWVVIVVDRHSFRGAALDAWLVELRQALAARA